MAIVSKLYTRISRGGATWIECNLEYHDDDFREINDDGDPDDFRIVRFYGTNFGPDDLVLLIQRGNGQNWVERTIPPGVFEQAAGGPVRYETDIPSWEWRRGS